MKRTEARRQVCVGADISVCGSSVNQRFDELPLRDEADAARRQPTGWRRA